MRTAKIECLDHFVIFGELHLGHVLREFVSHYNTERYHQGIVDMPRSRAGPVLSTDFAAQTDSIRLLLASGFGARGPEGRFCCSESCLALV